MVTLLEFALKDAGPATRVTGSVCTCQTHNQFAAPVFYCRIRSCCCSKVLSVLVHNPQLGVSIQTVQTEQSHLAKLRAFNKNWWQIIHYSYTQQPLMLLLCNIQVTLGSMYMCVQVCLHGYVHLHVYCNVNKRKIFINQYFTSNQETTWYEYFDPFSFWCHVVFIPVYWSKKCHPIKMFRKQLQCQVRYNKYSGGEKGLHEILVAVTNSLIKIHLTCSSHQLYFGGLKCLSIHCLFVCFSLNVWFILIVFFRSVLGLPIVLISQCFKTPIVRKTSLWSESPFVLQPIILKSKPTSKAKFLQIHALTGVCWAQYLCVVSFGVRPAK